jgi:glucuronate isomerase
MKEFLGDDFLLDTSTAHRLYDEFAHEMPIIDYHNHLPPDHIRHNTIYKNITEIWLKGDHYKWRAMRANGVDENMITGEADDKIKFKQWAFTVPYTMRNPLYHWTHLELQRYFGISELLNESTAESIYQKTSEQVNTAAFSTQELLKKMNVRVVCTTDDPNDDLTHHSALASTDWGVQMLPGFRPDAFIHIHKEAFDEKIATLGSLTDRHIQTAGDIVHALKDRIDFFHENGCRLSDHGLTHINAVDNPVYDVDVTVSKRLNGETINHGEAAEYESFLLDQLARIYFQKGWTMQFHLGAIRNNNQKLMNRIGADVGCDSIGDYSQAEGLSLFLNRLDTDEQLTKTILYNLNPSDNEVFSTMVGNFNDGNIVGKMQWGSGWWFLDQKDGMEDQMNVLSNMGLLSRFIGMLTDSRSFLSFPRHEYFRRILCNLIGNDVEKGELPNDIEWLGKMVQDICYNNAKRYFEFPETIQQY